MLAAFDVRRACPRVPRHSLWCYTFGGALQSVQCHTFFSRLCRDSSGFRITRSCL